MAGKLFLAVALVMQVDFIDAACLGIHPGEDTSPVNFAGPQRQAIVRLPQRIDEGVVNNVGCQVTK